MTVYNFTNSETLALQPLFEETRCSAGRVALLKYEIINSDHILWV